MQKVKLGARVVSTLGELWNLQIHYGFGSVSSGIFEIVYPCIDVVAARIRASKYEES